MNHPKHPNKEVISFITGPECRLRVFDSGGPGPTLVFLHGLGGSLNSWRPQLDGLAGLFRVVAFDQRGHGESDRAKSGTYTIEGLVADLEAVRSALNITRMVLVGHSMSGFTLTDYVSRYPQFVTGLVYLDALVDFSSMPAEALDFVKDWNALEPVVREQLRIGFEGLLGPKATAVTIANQLSAVEKLDPAACRGLRESLFKHRLDRSGVDSYVGPTVAIEVEGPAWPAFASSALAIRRIEVADVSHWIQLEKPEVVNTLLIEFMGRALQ
jgi:pimeloyl-ACP methyl ester carboxylesterase